MPVAVWCILWYRTLTLRQCVSYTQPASIWRPSQRYGPNGGPRSHASFLCGYYNSGDSGGENNKGVRFDPHYNNGPDAVSEEDLILLAQSVVRADLGVADPSLLDDESFVWISSTIDQPLAKVDYIAAGRFFNLRGAFPDLEYRAYDFRVMDGTVRCTCRVSGTMLGGLRLRDGTLPPNGKEMQCPPEGVSIDIDPVTGLVTKICSGFCLDRFVGNTNGLTGVQAASIIAGKDISAFENLPVTTVLYSVVSRPAKKLGESANFVAPFPPTVMIQLAKGVLITKMAYDDPSLLSEDFEYITPFAGPIRKGAFLKSYAVEELSGYYPNFRNFRVDPYEPTRVWIDLQPTSQDYVGHPQCMSLTFDDDGYCTRVTSSAVLDPSIGNAGGLGGPEGLKYARGIPSAAVSARPLPRVFGRIRKRVFSPLTGVGVDEYQPASNGFAKQKNVMTPQPPAEKPRVTPVASQRAIGKTSVEESTKRPQSVGKRDMANGRERQQRKATPERNQPPTLPPGTRTQKKAPTRKNQNPKKTSPVSKATLLSPASRVKQQTPKRSQPSSEPIENEEVVKRLEQLKDFTDSIRIIPEQLSRSFSLRPPLSQAEKPREPTRKDAKRIINNRLASLRKKEPKRSSASPTNRNGTNSGPVDAQARKLELARKIQAERREKMGQAERERLLALARQRRDAARGNRPRGVTPLNGLANTGTFNVGANTAKKQSPKAVPPRKSAPFGVPSLSRWRRNSDMSVSGLVKGSRAFEDGARVTTSPITSGTIASGEVVRTGSGSRYFLE